MKAKNSFIFAAALAAAIVAAGLGQKALAAMTSPATQETAPVCSITIPKPEPKHLAELAKIDAATALNAAQKAYPGIVVKEVELDNENGCLVYSLALQDGGEVLVDAGNGNVIRRETARTDSERLENKEEQEDND